MRVQFLTAVALVLLGTAWAVPQQAERTDLDKLQGTWRAVGAEVAGKKAPENAVAQAELALLITGNKYAEKQKGETVEEGTIKLSPEKTPRHMDIIIGSGKDKGKTQLALYKLDGDTLTVALTAAGSTERPTSFTTGPDSTFSVQTFRREKKKEESKD